MHRSIADRVFRAVGPAAYPVRVVHDGIETASYATVRTALDAGGRAAGMALAAASADNGGGRSGSGSLADHPHGRPVLAALNGSHGDLLARDHADLALPMTLRHDGRDLARSREALATAYPDANGRLAVFLHGLGQTERAWRYKATRHYGDASVTYGELLRRDLGYSPVWVSYNTGLHVSENGRLLAALLDEVAANWPVPVQELVLVGYSMGGLICRSALHQGAADGACWTSLVRDTITVCSPHLGAPLEKGANVLGHALDLAGETRPFARILKGRSAGIKDLRYGNLSAADWDGHDPDALLTNTRTPVPLHPTARHFVVLGTLLGEHDSLPGNVLGDLLVRPRSACGDTGDEARLPIPAAHVHRVRGVHHLDLLNHPVVYEHLRDWLARPSNRSQASGGAEA